MVRRLSLVAHDQVVLPIGHADEQAHEVRIARPPHAVLVKERVELLRPAAGAFVHRLARGRIGLLRLAVADGLQQRLLARKVMVESALGQARAVRICWIRGPFIPLRVKEGFRRAQDLLAPPFAL